MLDPEVFTQAIDGSAAKNFINQADVAQITCPTLLFGADPALGGVIDDVELDGFTSVLPLSLVMPMLGVGHNLHSEKPVEFSAAVVTFPELLKAIF